jgi:hypothetical protein
MLYMKVRGEELKLPKVCIPEVNIYHLMEKDAWCLIYNSGVLPSH